MCAARGPAGAWRATACAVAVGLVASAAAQAGVRYVWADKDGVVRVTRDSPGSAAPYEVVTVPDDVAWRSPPAMASEVPAEPKPSTKDLFKQASGSVYWVESRSKEFGAQPAARYGSAVAISEEQVLTNCHVLGGEKRSYVVGSGKSQSTDEVEVVAANYDADRCVLKVRGLFLQPVRGVRAVSGLEVGESVYAIGNPRGLQRTFTDGLVSGVRAVGELRLIQMTAAISPGSSGGGLFDSSGNLLGITSSSLRGAQSVNFAIPAEDFWR